MKYFVDLDDTLVSSTVLNNDAYNFALEHFGYKRIVTNDRITRETISTYQNFKRIIDLKQQYFTLNWLPYRIVLNNELLAHLKKYEKFNCFLWTKADKNRTNKILVLCDLRQYFSDVIFDKKEDFKASIQNLKEFSNSNQIIIYENNHEFFTNQNYKIIEEIKNKAFDVKGYLV